MKCVSRNTVIYIILITLLIALLVADLLTGSVRIGAGEILQIIRGGGDKITRTLIVDFRLSRVITAVVAGIALSLSGLQMQTIFRNPLAGPYVLGISAGASLGVAILILGFSSFVHLDSSFLTGTWAMVAAACTGSAFVLMLILVTSLRVRDIMTVLILGIMFASAVSAIVSVMQYFSNESMLKAFVIWTMGSLGNLNWTQVWVMSVTVVTGIIIVIGSIKPLDALLPGEEYASSVGVNVRSVRMVVFMSTSIMAGAVTAFCGPLAFVGIAVPHIARIILRKNIHRSLVPGSVLIGAIMMLAADIVSQLPGNEKVLPVNSVTALVGIPVVIWVIIRRKKISAG